MNVVAESLSPEAMEMKKIMLIMKVVAESLSPEAMEMKKIVLDRFDLVDKKKTELKQIREMLNASFVNDKRYRDAKETEGKGKHSRLSIENKILLANPKLSDKLLATREELKDLKEALSDYLAEFVRISGKTELEHPDGRKLSIVKRYKISPGQQRMDI